MCERESPHDGIHTKHYQIWGMQSREYSLMVLHININWTLVNRNNCEPYIENKHIIYFRSISKRFKLFSTSTHV